VSFETEFFGPGNRLRWDAMQSGSLPAEVGQRLGSFVEDLERDRDIVALPRVREDGGEVVWYVLCSSPRTARIARDEVQAFLGPTYSNFEGRPTQLDPSDPVEAAVLAKYRNNAFRVEITDHSLFEIARERLGLLTRFQKERPLRKGRRTRAAGRVLRDFEYALLTNQERVATDCIEELRAAGQLSAANLLFLEVRRLAAGQHWGAILALPELELLLSVAKPRRVTEALIRAVYSTYLKEFEENGRVEVALDRFRSEVWPRFRNLYQTRANLFGFEVDASFLMAATTAPGGSEIREAVLDAYAPASPARAYLAKLLDFIRKPPSAPAVDPLASAREAYTEGDIDRAYGVAMTLAPSFNRTALLLRCAHEMGTLVSARVALESIASLSPPERIRLEQNLRLTRMQASLEALTTAESNTTAAPAPAEEIPSSWPEWLKRLRASEPWKSAVFVAETGAREWTMEKFLQDANVITETADLLLDDRPTWGQEALRDALPYFVEFCISPGADARLKPVFESLFIAIAVDPQVSLPQTGALIRIAEARLELGVSTDEYGDILKQLGSALQATESPSVAELALEALEMLVNAACPNIDERRQFAIQVVAIFQRWYKRVHRAQLALLKTLAEELGMGEATGDLAKKISRSQAASEWVKLEGKRIAMYSLQKSALQRAALVIGELCPGIRIDTFSDHVGGSAALKKASMSADIFIIATRAAKHAATSFIEDHRPKDLKPLYARGQGSASLFEALRKYMQSAVGADA
jgi:hypothetical protein